MRAGCARLSAVALATAGSLFLSPSMVGAASKSATMAGNEVDLELVLAVDVSRSMDQEEQRVQRQGYVEAFRHPEVIKAITQGGIGRIAVTYVEWSGPGAQVVTAPWTIIDGAPSANAFADLLGKNPIERWNGTSISGALQFSGGLFGTSGYNGIRRVIDISGDGPNNMGPPVVPVRDAVLGQGVTVNGLPIMLKNRYFADGFAIASLDAYYKDCVIGGTGAFVIVIEDLDQFAAAIRRKLVLEIADIEPGPPVIKVASTPPTDCMVGEKQRVWAP